MTFDRLMARVSAGERLSVEEIGALANTPDVLSIGMLADAVRRRLHGTRVTYLRVASGAFDEGCADRLPAAAREIRITGVPGTLAAAVAVVERAKAAAGDRPVSGLSWLDVERLALASGAPLSRALADLRAAGLDGLADMPIDVIGDSAAAVDSLRRAGFERVHLTFEHAPAAERVALIVRAAALQDEVGGIRAINPLPTAVQALRPTTGYEDVKAVAIARLAAPGIPTVQVDWQRYGPKLAQVALTFGADDLDNVTSSDDAPDGRRRAPIEEVRRNIEAAGFVAVERDGRFRPVDDK